MLELETIQLTTHTKNKTIVNMIIGAPTFASLNENNFVYTSRGDSVLLTIEY